MISTGQSAKRGVWRSCASSFSKYDAGKCLYDIKAVTFFRGDVTQNNEAFLITLQKEKSVAVCFMAAANWVSLASTALDDAKRCDVR